MNLFSDTQTRPTEAMRAAMAAAEVGDEQRQADPTTVALEERVADMLGKEAAVFLPTGTMANLIAVAVHTRPGDAMVVELAGHVLRSETSGAAAVNGCVIETISGERGTFTPEQLRFITFPGSRYTPPTRLVCLEQTHNFAGGTVWPIDRYRAVTEAAHQSGLVVHTDGARLMNAVVASGVDASDWGSPVDSIWIDFTKGLGAPIGAVLAGTAAFVEEAWMFKHRFGGAMRQSGVAAAGCLHALDHHVERLAEDHENARRLAQAFSEQGFGAEEPETNLVYVDPRPLGLTAADVAAALEDRDVEVSVIADLLRACTHLDVTAEEVAELPDRLSDALAALRSAPKDVRG